MSKAKRKKQFYLLSLGCSKNTVDSESMAALLGKAGYRGVSEVQDASVLMVNTCGFVEGARQESNDALRELVANKKKDQLVIALCACCNLKLLQEVADPQFSGRRTKLGAAVIQSLCVRMDEVLNHEINHDGLEDYEMANEILEFMRDNHFIPEDDDSEYEH